MHKLGRILFRSVHTTIAPFAPKKSMKHQKLIYGILGGVGIGASYAGYAAIQEWKLKQQTIPNTQTTTSYIIKEKPPFEPSRIIKYPLDMSGLVLTLYQYQTCPFCCKVRAMLDYFGISYNVVEVNPVLRTQLKWSHTYRKVPILIVETAEGDVLQLNDSSMIISAIYSYLIGQKTNSTKSTDARPEQNPIVHISNCYPAVKFMDEHGKEQTEIMNKYFLMYEENMDHGRKKEDILEERKWRQWADSVYVHTLSPNIYRTISEAIDSFNYFDEVGEWEKNFSRWERYLVIYVGAGAMWLVGKRLQKRYSLKPDVRKSLYEESDVWMRAIKKKKTRFMGGDKPNLADLAVFGVLSSIEGCEAFKDLSSNSTIVKDWYIHVKKHLTQGNSL